jgi:2-polyprenyl-6-methoxyphenol hydroxylase-like FAD-dependent oxidoreductase
MSRLVDALVIGGGPAGAASAIFLARAGWQVLLVEQSAYPRQKVCGECVSAGSLQVLDELGIGEAFRSLAGPELCRVGWMDGWTALDAEFPACADGPYPYGRAIGRDRLDQLLIERARSLGVEVLQPAKVAAVRGGPGAFEAELEWQTRMAGNPGRRVTARHTRCARAVVDAHGSWEPPPRGVAFAVGAGPSGAPKKASDLFAFKASFAESGLAPGLLPVISLDGGYGGVVVAERGRTTLACCIRRDRLQACRRSMPGAAAGAAVADFLQRSCAGVRRILLDAQQLGAWLSVGPIRPGIRVGHSPEVFCVGNAAGESHPLVGEGIGMALQSARLLAEHLSQVRPQTLDTRRTGELNRGYARVWRGAFAGRIRFAATAAHAAMHPALSALSRTLLARRPAMLTRAARWAGKAKPAILRRYEEST